MLTTAGRYLGLAVVLTTLVLSPALGYAAAHVLLIVGAVGALLSLVGGVAPSTSFAGPPPPSSTGEDPGTAGASHGAVARSLLLPPPRSGGGGPRVAWWRGRPHAQTLLFALAFALLLVSALATLREPADLLALVPYLAPLCFLPFAYLVGDRDWPVARLALIGAAVGLVTTLALRYGIGNPRAGEGSFITDPYRLSVTTLLLATIALGALFTRDRWRWLSLLGLVAAAATIWLTGSRTTLLGVPVLLLVTALCFVRRPSTVIAALVGVAAIGAAGLFIELPGVSRAPLWQVVANIMGGQTVADESIAIRLKLWSDGLAAYRDAPFFGHGWGDWMMAPLRANFPADLESLPNIVHMHNDALHFAMAGGILGLSAWLLLLAAPVAGYLSLPRGARTRQRLHGILVVVVGYFALGLADVMLASPAQLTLYVALTVIVLSAGRPETAR